MIFSLVRYLRLMHCPEIAMCKSLYMMNELHGKDFFGHTSDLSALSQFDLSALSQFITRRMFCGNHQIFCNFISSDMELNVNIGKL